MWGIVGTLMSTFVLIRDFFIYLIPGAVLFLATLATGLPQSIVAANAARVAFVPKPEWLKLAVVMAVCYVIGHALVAVGYMFVDRFRMPPAVDSGPIYYRYRYPSLYYELERRSIMADFRLGLGVSLLLSTIVLILAGADWRLPVGAVVVALIMLWSNCTARAHVAAYGAATAPAAPRAGKDNLPPEPRVPRLAEAAAKPKPGPTE